jgi:hypothetical protein
MRINAKYISALDPPIKTLNDYLAPKLDFILASEHLNAMSSVNINPISIYNYIRTEMFLLSKEYNISKTCLLIKVKRFDKIIIIKVFVTGKINIYGKQTTQEANYYNTWINELIHSE